MAINPQLPPLLVGLSGVSCCGKTTLARLLTRIFPLSSILHADDFYFPDSQVPIHDGIQDWDCSEAIDVKKLVGALKRLKAGESVKAVHDGVASTEIPEAEVRGPKNAVDEELLEQLSCEVAAGETDTKGERGTSGRPPLVIIDGFLLFGESVREIRDQLDIKILLRSTYEDSKQRREAKSGYYITHEGYWEDPPGYFDHVVWPNFVKNHDFLFQGNDVHGQVNEDTAESYGIDVVPGLGQRSMEETLRYVCSLLLFLPRE